MSHWSIVSFGHSQARRGTNLLLLCLTCRARQHVALARRSRIRYQTFAFLVILGVDYKSCNIRGFFPCFTCGGGAMSRTRMVLSIRVARVAMRGKTMTWHISTCLRNKTRLCLYMQAIYMRECTRRKPFKGVHRRHVKGRGMSFEEQWYRSESLIFAFY